MNIKLHQLYTVNENRNKIYVAYGSSNIVSVIDGDSKNVTQVKVAGSQPWAIAVNPNTNKIYVIDIFSNIVSVIDGDSNNVVAGIIFNISPSDSGHIKCNNRESSSKQYIDFGTQCVAEPNKGFQFSSWIEDLGQKSTKTISTSTVSIPLNSFLSTFGIGPKDTSANFNVTQFGNFTANFKEASFASSATILDSVIRYSC